MTEEELAAVQARYEDFQRQHAHMGSFACCCAHASADDVPALLNYISQLEAELAEDLCVIQVLRRQRDEAETKVELLNRGGGTDGCRQDSVQERS